MSAAASIAFMVGNSDPVFDATQKKFGRLQGNRIFAPRVPAGFCFTSFARSFHRSAAPRVSMKLLPILFLLTATCLAAGAPDSSGAGKAVNAFGVDLYKVL